MVNFAALGVVSTWIMIMLCHLAFVRSCRRGAVERPAFRLPGSPWTEYVTLVFLALVIILMAVYGGAIGRWTDLLAVPIALCVYVGWLAVRREVRRRAALVAAGLIPG